MRAKEHRPRARFEDEHLGREGEAACRSLAMRRVGSTSRHSIDQVVSALSVLLDDTLAELSTLLGTAAAGAIANRALHVARRRRPLLALVETATNGLRLDAMRQPGTGASQAAVEDALVELFVVVMEVTASLIGYDLVQPVLRRLGGGRG